MPGFELFGDAERKEVNEVLESGILARYGFEDKRNNIWKAKELEQELQKVTNAGYVHAVSSGTAALTTAMMALGIGAGHEVILPTFGHVSCFEAIVTVGAIPVLADIDETLTLDPIAVEATITSKTRAVLAVHTCGAMAQLDELKDICERYKLILIEDASQSIGGSYNGKVLGTVGVAGVYSFDFLSTITCGEGGAILTNDPFVYKRCDEYSDHGHDHLAEHRSDDNHRYFGANHRISELNAAVGVVQVRRLVDILATQRKNYNLMLQHLSGNQGISLRKMPDAEGASYSHLSFSLPTEELAREAANDLQAASVPNMYWYESKWHYIRRWEHFKNGSWMNRLYNDHKKEILHYSNQVFPISDAIISRCISVPISVAMSEADADQYGSTIDSTIKRIVTKNIETV